MRDIAAEFRVRAVNHCEQLEAVRRLVARRNAGRQRATLTKTPVERLDWARA